MSSVFLFYCSFVLFGLSAIVTVIDAEQCCTWNFKDCGQSNYCNTAKDPNCEGNCNGHWVDTGKMAPGCIKRWASCLNSDQCCNDGESTKTQTCQLLPGMKGVYSGCQVDDGGTTVEEVFAGSYACSWNMKAASQSHWCNLSEENCVDHCWGFWIKHTEVSGTTCTQRWHSCSSDADCCDDGNERNAMTCQELVGSHGGTYMGCQLKDPNPVGLDEGCFEVSPDFSCVNANSWDFCFVEAYNRVFLNGSSGSYLNIGSDIPPSCQTETGRRSLGDSKKKKTCNKCGEEELPSDCNDCRRRKLSMSAYENFRSLFHECLVEYFPSEMSNIAVSDVQLAIVQSSQC